MLKLINMNIYDDVSIRKKINESIFYDGQDESLLSIAAEKGDKEAVKSLMSPFGD